MLDPYAVLGVERAASQAELKSAHRALVRHHHPDLRPAAEQREATARVQEINVAYGMVRDAAHRSRTDALLEGRQGASAVQWDEVVTEAGRWAGGWWRRNRASLARARRAGRRAALGLVGRIVWLTTAAIGAVGGFVLSFAIARLFVEQALFATLGGALGGVVVGSELGVRTARRLSGEASSAWTLRVTVAGWVVAVALGTLVDRAIA